MASEAASLPSAEEALHGEDIAKVLSSKGPVVKCVLLKAIIRPSETSSDEPGDSEDAPTVRLDRDKAFMKQIELDTTPSKSMVPQTLGGPFTFLGQYEEEGVVLMIRDFPESLDWMDEAEEEATSTHDAKESIEQQHRDELKNKKLSELKSLCKERNISLENVLEKSELVEALMKWRADLPPFNKHKLQPPFDANRVRGDILILKVAETDEALDDDSDNDGDDEDKQIKVPTNEEFFLDYTLEEYLRFASRTDYEVPAQEEEESGDDEDDEHDEDEHDDHGDGAFQLGEDGPLEEEDKAAMFNLVMNEVLRNYREENGRGPNTQELLELRASIAKELDVKVAHQNAEQSDWNRNAKDGTPAKATPKKIGFSQEDSVLEFEPHPEEHDHHHRDDDEEEDDGEEEYYADDMGSDEEDAAEEEEGPPTKRQKIEPESEEEDTKPPATDSGNKGS